MTKQNTSGTGLMILNSSRISSETGSILNVRFLSINMFVNEIHIKQILPLSSTQDSHLLSPESTLTKYVVRKQLMDVIPLGTRSRPLCHYFRYLFMGGGDLQPQIILVESK